MHPPHSFKMKFLPLFLFGIVFSFIPSGVFILTMDMPTDWRPFIAILFVLLIIIMLFPIFLLHYYKVILKSNGIMGFNFWGKRYFLSFEELSKVESVNFFGLKYLKLFSSQSEVILWIPLFMTNIKAFSDQISLSTPKENPLREFYTKYTK